MKKTASLLAVLILLLTAAFPAVSAKDSSLGFSYYMDENVDRYLAMPIAYDYAGHIRAVEGYEFSTFKEPKGMYIDNQTDRLFVADTGNNCVAVLDLKGSLITVIKEAGGTALKGPEDIFVTAEGEIFIADTGNYRIIRLDTDYAFLQEYRKPTDSSLDSNFTFTPNKVGVSNIGMIYTLAQDSLMTLDSEGNFKGYLGETKSGFSLKRLLIRLFASDEQLEWIGEQPRSTYLSMYMAGDGFIYATTNDTGGQISKITSVGENIYKRMYFGESSYNNQGNQTNPNFVDITVDRQGMITIVDTNTGMLYQYDQEGNNICIFGSGKGTDKEEQLSLPSALEHDSEGNIYVLDAGTSMIHIYSPTDFIRSVHEAIYTYSEGDYDASEAAWNQVLDSNANYALAHKGLGNIYYKHQDWESSMKEYETANYRQGYSKAFEKARTDFSALYFGLVVLGVAAVLAVLILIVKYTKRLADHINDVMLGLKKRR